MRANLLPEPAAHCTIFPGNYKQDEVKNQQLIRNQVLRGITLKREPGMHFVGNFLDLSYDRVSAKEARITLDRAAHLAEIDGQINLGAFAV